MKLSYAGLKDRTVWAAAGIRLPDYDYEAAAAYTRQHPVWVHFGGGSLVRGFHARLMQSLLEQGAVHSALITADTFDYEIVDKVYTPYDNLSIMVSLKPDGSTEKEVVASIGESLRAGWNYPQDVSRMKEIFRAPSLQLVTFTITEKGYALTDLDGNWLPAAKADFSVGPGGCTHAMGWVAALLWERYQAGAFPLAVVSTDNCSQNGAKLRKGVLTMAEQWLHHGFVNHAYLNWLQDENQVSFPWTMIDKITPRPALAVANMLAEAGVEDIAPVITAKKSFVAPFVNAEIPQYLVIEDRFPNGRPPLERAGVYMTDRDTVNKCERMKVSTCLNPLHTALAIFGCLLGYTSIAAEMQDPQLKALVEKIGLQEGMPAVADPGILDPEAFIRQVLEERFPNPFIPDTPQRIATDTSQKIPIRFGETIKAYMARPNLNPEELFYIPLAIAGWLRYLLALDDQGQPMECSSDPMLPQLQAQLSGVTLERPESVAGKLTVILSNETLFGTNLVKAGLAPRIEEMFSQMLAGKGAVRRTLIQYLEGKS